MMTLFAYNSLPLNIASTDAFYFLDHFRQSHTVIHYFSQVILDCSLHIFIENEVEL